MITFDYWLWRCPECNAIVCHIPRPSWGQRLDSIAFERQVEWHEMTKHGIRAQEVAEL